MEIPLLLLGLATILVLLTWIGKSRLVSGPWSNRGRLTASLRQEAAKRDVAIEDATTPLLRQAGSEEKILRLLQGASDDQPFYALLPHRFAGVEDQLDHQGPRFVPAPLARAGEFRDADVCGGQAVLLPRQEGPLILDSPDGLTEQDYYVATTESLQAVAFATDVDDRPVGLLAVGASGQLLFSRRERLDFLPLQGPAPKGPWRWIQCWRGLILVGNNEGRYWVGYFVNRHRPGCLDLSQDFAMKNPDLATQLVAGAGRICILGQWHGWIGTGGGRFWTSGEGVFRLIHHALPPSGPLPATARPGITSAVCHRRQIIIQYDGALQYFQKGNRG